MNSHSHPYPHPNPYGDHMNAFFQLQQQQQQHQHQLPQGYGQPPRKQGDDKEVAGFLLQLKQNENSGNATEAELRMQAQRHAAFMRGGGVYPAVGAVYGYPTAGFNRQMLAGHERTPPLMEEPVVMTDFSFEEWIADSSLVVMKDRDLVPDALFVAMSQMKPCKMTQADRVGCYKTRELGFVGMCCKHCGGQPGFGRYFPNSVRSLAQTTTSQTILKHIGGKCRFCPLNVRKAVLELQRQQAHKEGLATGRPRYGSRKIFFQRMWARLHGTPHVEEEATGESLKEGEDQEGNSKKEKDNASKSVATDAAADDVNGEASEGVDGELATSEKKRKASDDVKDEEEQESNKKSKVVPI